MLPYNIVYWTQGMNNKNFGDYLSEIIFHKALIAPVIDADIYRLIGSTISHFIIENDLLNYKTSRPRLAYWGCGMRDPESIPDSSKEKCIFLGVRGPMTRDCLNLDPETPIGDPGLIMPLIYEPKSSQLTSGKLVCIPHYFEISKSEELKNRSGADVILSPSVYNEFSLNKLIDDICSADFVLAGSLHAAIIASAYRRPFAFWDTGFVDIPFKWNDFAASLGIDAVFFQDIKKGKMHYENIKDDIVLPKLTPILSVCPFEVRTSVVIKAICADLGISTLHVEEDSEKIQFYDHQRMLHKENIHKKYNLQKNNQ